MFIYLHFCWPRIIPIPPSSSLQHYIHDSHVFAFLTQLSSYHSLFQVMGWFHPCFNSPNFTFSLSTFRFWYFSCCIHFPFETPSLNLIHISYFAFTSWGVQVLEESLGSVSLGFYVYTLYFFLFLNLTMNVSFWS